MTTARALPMNRPYTEGMKQIWVGRAAEVVGKYAENSPTAAVCCNACRTCLTTNLLGLATAGLVAAGMSARRFVRRFAKPIY